jgi:aminoglycoside phosphotransferase (APT) family kinase protein
MLFAHSHDPRIVVALSLVQKLVAAQFPAWAHLPIRPVAVSGWDNWTFRLGEQMSVRLPSAQRYVPQVDKEHLWLPRLGPQLPLHIPVPLAKGLPTDEYPWPWSVYRWLEGEPAAVARSGDLRLFATSLARFLSALHQIDPAGGPAPGWHNFYRGGPLSVYDGETRHFLTVLDGRIDTRSAAAVWEAALSSAWQGSPVWVHGDVQPTNLLVLGGTLHAVIDFGCAAVGDPACDLVMAWTFFSGASRAAFRRSLPLDEATWARARGWALWKALLKLSEHIDTNPGEAAIHRRVIDAVLADHSRRR